MSRTTTGASVVHRGAGGRSRRPNVGGSMRRRRGSGRDSTAVGAPLVRHRECHPGEQDRHPGHHDEDAQPTLPAIGIRASHDAGGLGWPALSRERETACAMASRARGLRSLPAGRSPVSARPDPADGVRRNATAPAGSSLPVCALQPSFATARADPQQSRGTVRRAAHRRCPLQRASARPGCAPNCRRGRRSRQRRFRRT